MAEAVHFLNGELVSEGALKVSVRDLGFARGYAVFDFLITYPTHRPFMLGRHIDRLFNSAALIGLALPWSKEDIHGFVMQTLSANSGGGEKAIKITLSGGISSSLAPENDPTIVIVVDPKHDFPAAYYEKGVGIITEKFTRYIPSAKSYNYIVGVRQMLRAEKAGAVEPVYYDDTQVFEGATCNVFALIGGKLLTPKTNILRGITRGVLLSVLELGVPVEEADFSIDALRAADEVFLTASNKEVMPVTAIDGTPVGSGKVGEAAKEAMRQFREYTLSDEWTDQS
ncbi:MAG: aminotransferase class IV [Patescibacteria group bacterium]|nr:aminotransferase class IV [Patescibacteria group bacterium]